MFAQRAELGLHGRVTAVVVAISAALLVLGAAGILEAEKGSSEANIRTFPDALWWAMTTITTVGYGDRFPTTATGRFFAGILMLVGISLIGVVTASVATWFVTRASKAHDQAEDAEVAYIRADNEVLREHLERMETKLDAVTSKIDHLTGDRLPI